MLNNKAIVIEGINKVIEGLTDIKCGLMSTSAPANIQEVKTESVESVIKEVKEVINGDVKPEVKDEAKVEEAEEKAVETVEEDIADAIDEEIEEDTSRREELSALHINKLRVLAKEYGLSAGGSKLSLIDSILEFEATEMIDIEDEIEEAPVEETNESEDDEIEEDKEEVEEVIEEEEVVELEEDEEIEESESYEFTDEDVEEYKGFLEEEFELVELKEIAEMMEVSYSPKTTKKALIEKLVSDMPNLHEALDEMGCFQDIEDEEVEEVEEDSEDIAEELGLRDLSQEELADILAEHGLSTKGLKTALIDRIVLAVKNGIIEVEDDAPKLLTQKELETLKKKIFTIETEAFEEKELTPRMIQTFLKKYYVDDKKYHNYKQLGLTNQDALGLYIKAKQSLLDDYGTRRELMDGYLKDGKFHCCGRALIDQDDATAFCPNCHSVYEVKR